jgi:hypothetical protein
MRLDRDLYGEPFGGNIKPAKSGTGRVDCQAACVQAHLIRMADFLASRRRQSIDSEK